MLNFSKINIFLIYLVFFLISIFATLNLQNKNNLFIDKKVNLGLDLQGGMHVTLEVSPIDILKGLSSDSKDPDFLLAINNAREVVRGTQTNLISQFYTEFKAIAPKKDLSIIFATVSNRGRIGFDSSDNEILDIINGEIESAIDRSFNILRTRIDRFGTSQPNIQRLQGTGRIQIELPGVDNPERVRKLLQGVAKLEFWEVAELSETEIFQTLQIIDQFAVSANICLLYTSPSPRDATLSRMPSSA